VLTIAGIANTPGSNNGDGTVASFNFPSGLTYDAGSNYLFVADRGNHRIRRIFNAINGSPLTIVVSTYAGSGSPGNADSNVATLASFNLPNGITTDGNKLYVADQNSHRIRSIVILVSSVVGGIVSTLVGSVAAFVDSNTQANVRFNNPAGIVHYLERLYVADQNNQRIRETVVGNGATRTIIGNGNSGNLDGVTMNALDALLNSPYGVAADSSGIVYFTDTNNALIRRIDGLNITTIAGKTQAGVTLSGFADNITGTLARFFSPRGITISGSTLYVADTGNHAIRNVSTAGNFPVATTAGIGGTSGLVGDGFPITSPSSVRLDSPQGLALDSTGNIFIADTSNSRIRKIFTA